MFGSTLLRSLRDHEVWAPTRSQMDIEDEAAVRDVISRLKPAVVIHCAALANVDACERNPDLADRINTRGCAHVADACQSTGSRLIAVSTDYVFDGEKGTPYAEDDRPNPVNAYGISKLRGEMEIASRCEDHLVVRVAWLYGQAASGFLQWTLRSGSEPENRFKVVDDQFSNPTSAVSAALRIAESLLSSPFRGIMHLSGEGVASRHEFAQEALRSAGMKREIPRCASSELSLPARRPRRTALEKKALRDLCLPPMRDWREDLAIFMRENPRPW